MPQPVTDLMTMDFSKYNADRRYRIVIQQHLLYLKNHPDTRVVAVTEAKARPFYYNLWGYLLNVGYLPEQMYAIMLLSGMNSSEDFDETITQLVVPTFTVIDKIFTIASSV